MKVISESMFGSDLRLANEKNQLFSRLANQLYSKAAKFLLSENLKIYTVKLYDETMRIGATLSHLR